MKENEEEKPKNKGGRPPSPEKLLAKIKKLEEELVQLKTSKLDDVLSNLDLTKKAFSVILSEDKKNYNLVTIGYDLKTGLAKIEKVEFLADHYARAVFELKKMVANNGFLQEKK